MIVNGGEGDDRDVGPRECIGDNFVFSTDVTLVCGKYTYEKQVAILIRRTLGSTGEGKCEWLMISKDSELVALNVVVKVFYCEEEHQQFAIRSAVLPLTIGEFPGKEGHRASGIPSTNCSSCPPTAL